jgi:hypothetical protein
MEAEPARPSLGIPTLQTQLGDWEGARYDFYLCEGQPAPALLAYRGGQQDACQYAHEGILAATDGSVDLASERMGAGGVAVRVLGGQAFWELSAVVGGPPASLRAEAVSLLSLLQGVEREVIQQRLKLLVLIDCLVLLDILLKWGRADFWPQPCDVVHFDVIFPLLCALRKWPEQVVLLKVKSHAGCWLNELADAKAAAGRLLTHDPLHPGPGKYGSLLLRVQPALRTKLTEERYPLPRDAAPNKKLIRAMVAVNMKRAALARDTIFVRGILQSPHSHQVLKVIGLCDDSVV